MSAAALNPALMQLLRVQVDAKFRRLGRGFTTPRRAALSCLALLLALVWLGNAIASVVFREPYNRDQFLYWLPLVPFVYAGYHLVKAAWSRPEDAMEWSPSEREWLGSGPFSRTDLIKYRIAVILTATFVKATCATVLMLPDLGIPAAGFAGFFLGLAFVDILRMCIDIVAAGVSRRMFRTLRMIVFAMAGCVLLAAAYYAIVIPVASTSEIAISFGWINRYLAGIDRVLHSPLGTAAMTPFQPFAKLATAQTVSWALGGWFIVSVGMVLGLGRIAIRLDALLERRTAAAEQSQYEQRDSGAEFLESTDQFAVSLPRVASLGGIGPMAWRQLLGARAHFGGLLIAFIAPAVLSWLPLLRPMDAESTFIQVGGALAFYTLLLLPAALKFDFRRDVDRLTAFKALPIRPISIVLGQLAAPVLIATVFQLTVLVTAFVFRPFTIPYLIGAVAFLLPMNLLIFSTENIIFLLYPYRLNQEGLEVFFRTTLTFTAKSLLFAVAAVMVYLLAHVAREVAQLPVARTIVGGNHQAAFAVSMWCCVALGAGLFTWLLGRIYDRHDPCLDQVA